MRALGRLLGGVALLALIVGAVGCGSGDSSTGSDETTEVLYPRIKGPGREFIIPGGDNVTQFFGEEASAAERERASKVVQAWMKARVAEDWATDCGHLAREYVKTLVVDARAVSEGKAKNCPQALAFFGDAASGSSGNTLTGPIDSLRIRDTVTGNTEKEAFAQWHGPNEIDWILSLRKEGGAWKVAQASPSNRTK